MTHHHTTRTALDIRDRIETIQDRARRPEDQHSEIVADMQATVDLVRRWSWFSQDRRLIDTLTALTGETETAETGEDIAKAVATFCAAVRAVTDPF